MLERDIVRACRNELSKIGVITIKHSGGPFAEVGVSDLIGVIPTMGGRALYVECKRDKTCKLTPVQAAFLSRVATAGALTWVVKGMGDVQELVNFIRVVDKSQNTSKNSKI